MNESVAVEVKAKRENITGNVLRRLADKHGLQAVIDLITIFDEEYPERKEDKRRTFYVPTMHTLTR
ncbi:MAG: hypothetical protein HOJ13_02880 [Nitrospina sp.]|jgi:hypothetical protein|nr:hypothetical protein [Nitrospina sp.]